MEEKRRAKRNVIVLAACQALANSTMSIQIALGGLVGAMLAEDKSLATLPVAMVICGTAVGTIPASLLMGRIGRRAGFMVGGAFGIFGSILSCLGIYLGSFPLFAGSLGLFGIFSSFAQYYRFAAADVAPDDFKAKAISLVMAGGVVAGFLGPEITKHTRELLMPYLFQGSFVAAGILCALSVLIQQFIDIPRPPPAGRGQGGRPLSAIVRQPVFLVAVLSGAIGYAVMSLVMTATPLAMVGCGLSYDQSATVIQFHVIAMFGPSFFTGHLIRRFGVLRVIAAGGVLNLICVAVALAGLDFANFLVALVLLGLGWNFMFVGGTALLTEAYRPQERAKTQAANDFTVFAITAVASLSSGKILFGGGWNAVTLTALPLLAIALAAALWRMTVVRRIVG
ncbi:MAG: MFS transporter [Brevundimonas sp.]|uniref:MFS transporter n=1 Tax=Brevundimonas sp. TaxID=1871086 RepID=UPI00403498A7